VLTFYIKTLNPKAHIDACSFISYYRAEILEDKINDRREEFYGLFLVNGHPELYEMLSTFSSDIILEVPKNI
jgi:hypothetical protein